MNFTKRRKMIISIHRKSFDLQIYSSLKISCYDKRKKSREMGKCKLKMKFQSIYEHSYCEESNLFLRPDKTVVRCFNKFITSVTIIDLPINIVKAIPIYVSRVAYLSIPKQNSFLSYRKHRDIYTSMFFICFAILR